MDLSRVTVVAGLATTTSDAFVGTIVDVGDGERRLGIVFVRCKNDAPTSDKKVGPAP